MSKLKILSINVRGLGSSRKISLIVHELSHSHCDVMKCDPWQIVNELMSRNSHNSVIKEIKLSVAILFMILMSCLTPLMIIFLPLGLS